MSEPSLFHTGHFRFNAKDYRRAITFARVKGKSLRHIKADCTEPRYGLVQCKSLAVYKFLANLLNSGNHRLLTLKLTNLKWLRESTVHPRSDVIKLLATLLEHQQQLRVVDLSNARLRVKQGRLILKALSKHCSETVHTLNIDALISFKVPQDPQDGRYFARFISAMCSFRNLSDLRLPLGYLQDNVLQSLAAAAKNSLEFLTIRCHYKPRAVSRINPSAWLTLTSACPNLKVRFSLRPKEDSYFDLVPCNLLIPAIPLDTFNWTCGSLISLDNLQQCFEHLAHNFQNTLRHISLKAGVRLDAERIRDLMESIHECSQLETLSIRLKCDLSGDDEFYKTAIQDAVDEHRMTCAVKFNGHDVGSLNDMSFME
ncbi:F-box only protein 39-like [Physella acuta]|uniref:F-box only protein 39-like n=1 Tax=Physella acuta TaxID=109671 RepID=UPI0027DD53A8|nr:F-box only protein 39-like [Physella acuta]